MKVSIKEFSGGMVKDGDPSDLPPTTFKSMVNLDVDRARHKLSIRKPYRAYKEITPDTNILPIASTSAGADYYPYWVLRYDVGIANIQRNTLIVFRSKIVPTTWQIWCNGPMGGDGNDMIHLATEESASHCSPIAVAGKVRIALGNSRDYRIFMPFTWENRFPKSPQEYLQTSAQVRADYASSQSGRWFHPGVAVNFQGNLSNGQTPSKSYIYGDGRLYTQFATTNFEVSSGITVSNTDSASSKTPLTPGSYNVVVAPIFDGNPEQVGAPVAFQTKRIIDKPQRVEAAKDQPLTNGTTYNINQVFGYDWYVYSLGETLDDLGNVVRHDFEIKLMQTTDRKVVVDYPSGNTSSHFSPPDRTSFLADLSTGDSIDVLMLVPNSTQEYLDLRNRKSSEGSGNTGDFSGQDYGDGITEIFPCYAVQTITNPDWDNLITSQYSPSVTPSYTVVAETLELQSAIEDICERRYNDRNYWKVTGNTWKFELSKIAVVEPAEREIGQILSVSLNIPSTGINPRIKYFGVFVERKPEEQETFDLNLIAKIPVYDGASEEFGRMKFWVEGTSPYPTTFSTSIDIDERMISRNLGFWGVLTATGDGGFRPISHKESDITRRLGVMVHRKGRMYGGLIDFDEGQEIVAYTPIADGHDNLDVWFKPLVMAKGSGEANTWLVEWQDRLLMFQKNNLWYAGLDDKQDRFFYQFASTGFGVGTHIIRTIAKSRQAIFFASYDGIFRHEGGKPLDITTGLINDYWRFEVSKFQKDLAVAGFNNKTNEYWLAYPTLGDPLLTERGEYDVTDPNVVTPPDDSVSPNISTVFNNLSKYEILIWNDDETGRHWRIYRTYNGARDDKPAIFFADKSNDWVFLTNDHALYYWPGQSMDIADKDGYEDDKQSGEEPIAFELKTQFFGDRNYDMIPSRLHVIGETDDVGNAFCDLNVSITRNESGAANASEDIVIKKESRNPRKLDRRRCSSVQIAINGEADWSQNPKKMEIREISFDYFLTNRRT